MLIEKKKKKRKRKITSPQFCFFFLDYFFFPPNFFLSHCSRSVERVNDCCTRMMHNCSEPCRWINRGRFRDCACARCFLSSVFFFFFLSFVSFLSSDQIRPKEKRKRMKIRVERTIRRDSRSTVRSFVECLAGSIRTQRVSFLPYYFLMMASLANLDLFPAKMSGQQ